MAQVKDGTLAAQAQAAELIAGSDGTNAQVIATDADGNLQVDVLTAPAATTASDKVEDAAHASGATGAFVLGVRNDAAAGLTSTDGDYSPVATDSAGRVGIADLGGSVSVDDNGGSLTVDVGTALPAGANNIGDVDVLTVPADPFGAAADASVAAGATGSISAKLRRATQGLEDLKSLIVLAAGTNAIGKLAANSGVDIGDVDVLTQPARVATTDAITAKLATDAIQNGLTALTPKFAVIDAATSGDNTLLAAVASKKIRVLSLVLIAAGTVTVRFESGAAGTALFGQANLVANTGFSLPFSPVGWFETGVNTLLNLELSAAISVDGCFVYVEV